MLEIEYGLVIVKYRCPHCREYMEKYPDERIYKNGTTETCPYCETKFKLKAMKA